MNERKRDDSEILKLIEDWSAEAELTECGIEPDAFVQKVRERIGNVRSERPRREDRFRDWSYAVLAASAAVLAIAAFTFVMLRYPAAIDAQRQLARAQMISPLLPVIASDDPDRRASALVVARQIDSSFAAEATRQLALLDTSRLQAQATSARMLAYSPRIVAGLQKLQYSRDPGDRQAAIWNDLLPALKEAQRNRDDFVAVAIEYKKVLPFLRVNNPEVFLDSYWGELWILNILLDSRISPVVDAVRESAPKAVIVEQIFRQHAPGLPNEKRKAFEEAVAVYEDRLKTSQ